MTSMALCKIHCGAEPLICGETTQGGPAGAWLGSMLGIGSRSADRNLFGR